MAPSGSRDGKAETNPPDEPEPVNEYGTPLGLALEDQSIRDEEKADRG